MVDLATHLRSLGTGPRWSGKPWSTMLILAAAAALTYLVPGLSRFRPVSRSSGLAAWRACRSLTPAVRLVEWRSNGQPLQLPPNVEVKNPTPEELCTSVVRAGLGLATTQWGATGTRVDASPWDRPASRPTLPGREIEDPTGSAMTSFYAALARTLAGTPGAVTRILHFGDSPVTGDLISSGARSRLQTRFGDAGHGFIFAGRPWEWYNHHNVELSSSGWRMLSPLFRAGNDGCYGLGGVCFVGDGDAAWCQVGTVARGLGSAVARFDVHFEARPGAGTLLASVDGGPPVEIATGQAQRAVRVRPLEVPDGPHVLRLTPKGDGEVVLFGVALERGGPGVVYDSLGTNGGTVHFLTLIDEGCWREELALRAPDLVILNYGTNESGYGYFSFPAYAEDIRRVVQRIREAVPSVSILLMAPMDRGTFDENGEIVTLPTIPKIVSTQRGVALETGCAYFDTFAAMGGEGTMGRWYRGNTRLVTGDLTHPTGAGADVVAGLLVRAIEDGFASFTRSAESPEGSSESPVEPPSTGPTMPPGEAARKSRPAGTATDRELMTGPEPVKPDRTE